MIEAQYECCDCGWVGTHAEMGSDSLTGYGDAVEIGSNWICPRCGQWGTEDDYKVIVPVEDFTLEVEVTIPNITRPKEIA